MTDIAAQREARRLKLMKNAGNRMNRLCGKDNDDGESEDTASALPKTQKNEDDSGEYLQSRTDEASSGNMETRTSPYNLRHRTHTSSPEPPVQLSSKPETPSVPYEIVEDPEVPDLAEFLATREAAKAADGKSRVVLPPKRLHDDKQKYQEKHIEYIRVIGIFFTALVTRSFLSYNVGFDIFMLKIIFQSMFFPFLLFEVLISFLQHYSHETPKGSLLTTALVLCGVRAELVQVYIKIMMRVTVISNDFFTYIFAFLVWHAVIG